MQRLTSREFPLPQSAQAVSPVEETQRNVKLKTKNELFRSYFLEKRTTKSTVVTNELK